KAAARSLNLWARLFLFFGFDAGGGVAVILVVLLHLRGDAHHFDHVVIRRLQLHGELHGDPGLGIHLGIVDGHRPFQIVAVGAVEALLDVHGIARWVAGFIEPDFFRAFAADGVYDERVVVRPLAHRITVIARLGNIFGELAAIDPDGAPSLFKF